MTLAPFELRQDYWEKFEFQDADLEYLYNFLLEVETPQTPQELVRALVAERIRQEKQTLQKQQKESGSPYLPKEHYEVGQYLLFPTLQWQRGKVVGIRSGNNPELPPFEVIEVEFPKGVKRNFAAGLENHILNQPVSISSDDPNLDLSAVLKKHEQHLVARLTTALENNPDLVRIAGRWFPRALLVDVNIGHLNLAEALLDMEGGGPLTTQAILEQIELPTDVNLKLTEFSLNLALQEDGRFDEVGPAGKILWFLRRLEPQAVQKTPVYLQWQPAEYNQEQVAEMRSMFEGEVSDELETVRFHEASEANQATLSLIYPHWQAGTLPLSESIRSIFPTAYESPRVLFTFIDGQSGKRFSGWVVLPWRYVYGLGEWYAQKGIIPGSLIHLKRGENPGEVVISAETRRTTRDWIRTALVGADGSVVFAMLKQHMTTSNNERMTIFIPDKEALERVWETGAYQKKPLEKVVITIMRELAKLSPQGHVHAQELYAAVNVVRRSPPGPILNLLLNRPWAKHLGDLYFRLDESSLGRGNHE